MLILFNNCCSANRKKIGCREGENEEREREREEKERKKREKREKREKERERGKRERERELANLIQNLNLPFSSSTGFKVKYYSLKFNILNSFPLSSSTSSLSHFLKERDTSGSDF